MTYSYQRTANVQALELQSPRPCAPLGSHGIAWGWTTPVLGPQLVLRPLWPLGISGCVMIDQPDGQIVLRPQDLDPKLVPDSQELLAAVRIALPVIVRDWAACLIDAGMFTLSPTTTGCRITVHPGDPKWCRTVIVPVPWARLIGNGDPLEIRPCYEQEGPVALLGGRGEKYRVDLAKVMWPQAFGRG